MTLILGMKARDGVLLVADCYGTNGGSSRFYTLKIETGLHAFGDEQRQISSGVYYGTAGYYTFVDIGGLARNVFAENEGVAGLLTSKRVLTHTLDALNKEIDVGEQEFRSTRRTDDVEKGRRNRELGERIKKTTLERNMRSFIESTLPCGISKVSRLLIRFSSQSITDLLLMRDGKVEVVEMYEAIGSGENITKTHLLENGHSYKTIGEALPIAVEAINKTLQDTTNFKGYQIVLVRQSGEGTLKIETAFDLKAQRLDIHTLEYLDPWFRPKESKA